MKQRKETASLNCPWCGEVKRPQDIMAAAAQMPTKLQRAIRGLTEAEISQRPLPSDWSLREIIAHLADAEIASGFRCRMMVAEELPVIQPFDERAWGNRLAYDRRDFRTLLRSFRAQRAANLDLLCRLEPLEWERSGRHPEFGLLTLAAV